MKNKKALQKRRKAYRQRRTTLANFETATRKLAKVFENKHGYQFTGFVADDPSGIAVFIDEYFFSIGDIYEDLKENIPKNVIFEWHDHLLEHDVKISFNSYLMGARAEMLKDKKRQTEK